MELKTLTWDIGGGKLLQDGADPLRMASYAKDGLDAIAGLLKRIVSGVRTDHYPVIATFEIR
jgi:hypothetical protein